MDIPTLASKVLPNGISISQVAVTALETRLVLVAGAIARAFKLGVVRKKQGMPLITYAVGRVFKREMYAVCMKGVAEYLSGPRVLFFSKSLLNEYSFNPPDEDTGEIFIGCIEYVACEFLQAASTHAQRKGRATIVAQDVAGGIHKDLELDRLIKRIKDQKENPGPRSRAPGEVISHSSEGGNVLTGRL
jgi:hypothetical protein